ncbi:hypothetical protein IV203_027319 [Nitzschia inconspicua]|uniref:Uncharacterized protein n=1 Tax=Nitzschia inconspicua TaxID=303405 RepID=A0A9K3LX15_9STRA|nr:hypothetical protein IV203_027319 [Nitzschia inconspicua]
MIMRFFVLVATSFLAADAFSPACQRPFATTLQMTSETHINRDYTAGSGMNDNSIPVLIKNLNKDNFEESLEMLEPLLMNECVGEECELFMGQLNDKATEIGMKVPDGYAPSHH